MLNQYGLGDGSPIPGVDNAMKAAPSVPVAPITTTNTDLTSVSSTVLPAHAPATTSLSISPRLHPAAIPSLPMHDLGSSTAGTMLLQMLQQKAGISVSAPSTVTFTTTAHNANPTSCAGQNIPTPDFPPSGAVVPQNLIERGANKALSLQVAPISQAIQHSSHSSHAQAAGVELPPPKTVTIPVEESDPTLMALARSFGSIITSASPQITGANDSSMAALPTGLPSVTPTVSSMISALSAPTTTRPVQSIPYASPSVSSERAIVPPPLPPAPISSTSTSSTAASNPVTAPQPILPVSDEARRKELRLRARMQGPGMLPRARVSTSSLPAADSSVASTVVQSKTTIASPAAATTTAPPSTFTIPLDSSSASVAAVVLPPPAPLPPPATSTPSISTLSPLAPAAFQALPRVLHRLLSPPDISDPGKGCRAMEKAEYRAWLLEMLVRDESGLLAELHALYLATRLPQQG